MLIAVNRRNKELIPTDGNWVCNQGKLLLEIDKNPNIEVLVDRDLPGDLRVEDLIDIIKKKYPQVQISLITKEEKPIIVRPSFLPYLAVSILTGLLTITLFIILSKDFSHNSIYVKHLYISVGVAMLVNFCITYTLFEGGKQNFKINKFNKKTR